ncbi:MAG: cytochrome c3 family protein, partial [Ketobacteraceae bacterium]|nr:cytochrome c3 family protein [Ketobacteraceae bacterium]
QTAGCHNYHDNRALYEDFLAKHINEPDFKTEPALADPFYEKNLEKLAKLTGFEAKALQKSDANLEAESSDLINDWYHSSHASAGVNCQQCHGSGESYVEKPAPEDCKSCHAFEVETFLKGKHGMRLAAGLSPMSPDQSKLPMHREEHKELTCNTCHSAHEFDTDYAEVEACLGCHNDEHSQAYRDSKHYQHVVEGRETAVTCATCHMPRVETEHGGIDGFKVNHNQNDTLRPNEKMIRPVCLDCHGLQFSLNALADEALIKSNFKGMPSVHIESIDWVEKRNQNKKESVY